MIDWQLTIDGKFPPGWDPHKDGWFPDFDLQSYLLPYFDVGDKPIDEYGTTIFDQSAIQRLLTRLECLRSELKAKRGRQRDSDVIQRDQALQVIDKTLSMIEKAMELKCQLVFRGD